MTFLPVIYGYVSRLEVNYFRNPENLAICLSQLDWERKMKGEKGEKEIGKHINNKNNNSNNYNRKLENYSNNSGSSVQK